MIVDKIRQGLIARFRKAVEAKDFDVDDRGFGSAAATLDTRLRPVVGTWSTGPADVARVRPFLPARRHHDSCVSLVRPVRNGPVDQHDESVAEAAVDIVDFIFRVPIENGRRARCGHHPPANLTRDAMYLIDLTHYLNAIGVIAPERGPARKMAAFLTAVVAHASDFDRCDDVPGPACFKCRKRDQRTVDTAIVDGDVVVWRCRTCGTEGEISNWQNTFWDLSQGAPSS